VKLQVERDPLAEAVAWTARALPARPTAPVLAGMRLQAGSELTLSTFDYEVSAQAGRPRHRRVQDDRQVRQRHVHPHAAPCRGVPDAA
jgi:hypothetical protein